MKRDIKVVVADIDGTMIPNQPHTMTDYGRQIMTELHNGGVLIGAASGRNVSQIKAFEDEFKLPFQFDIIIGQNGVELYELESDTNDIMGMLDKDTVKYIVTTMLNKFPDLNPSCYNNGNRLVLRDQANYSQGNHNSNMPNEIARNVEQFWEKDRPKVMFRVTEEVMAEIYPYAKEIENGKFYAMRTQQTMLEFMNVEATKGKCLEKYMKKHNLDPKYVMAFGDMDNDDDMLIAAGTGVALKNSAEGTLKIADEITKLTNDEDGMHHYIKEELLD